jgi:adenylate cyclase
MKGPTPLAHEVESEILMQLCDFEGSIAEAAKAISLAPNDPDSHFAMGFALIFAGRHREAAESLKRALRRDPSHPQIYVLGIAYLFMKQFEKAATLLERAFKSNPRHDVPLLYLIAAYAHLGREQEAKAALAKLRELNPKYSYLYYFQAVLKLKNPADWDLLEDGLRKAGMEYISN